MLKAHIGRDFLPKVPLSQSWSRKSSQRAREGCHIPIDCVYSSNNARALQIGKNSSHLRLRRVLRRRCPGSRQ
eukprot:5989499-Prorocentrum_lima.AAC.1